LKFPILWHIPLQNIQHSFLCSFLVKGRAAVILEQSGISDKGIYSCFLKWSWDKYSWNWRSTHSYGTKFWLTKNIYKQ